MGIGSLENGDLDPERDPWQILFPIYYHSEFPLLVSGIRPVPNVEVFIQPGTTNGLVMHCPFDPDSEPGLDLVSGRTLAFQQRATGLSGGTNFHGRQRLIVEPALEIGREWTIMAWFHCPMPKWQRLGGIEGFQNLCANAGMNGGHVLMKQGCLGVWISAGSRDYRGESEFLCSPSYDVRKLPDGWHHLATVVWYFGCSLTLKANCLPLVFQRI